MDGILRHSQYVENGNSKIENGNPNLTKILNYGEV